MTTNQSFPNEIVTNDLYWDCECDAHYIHPKSDWNCPRCGVDQTDMPDSRVDEITIENIAPDPTPALPVPKIAWVTYQDDSDPEYPWVIFEIVLPRGDVSLIDRAISYDGVLIEYPDAVKI